MSTPGEGRLQSNCESNDDHLRADFYNDISEWLGCTYAQYRRSDGKGYEHVQENSRLYVWREGV